MGDALMKLDKMLEHLLLIPNRGETKGEAALREAKRMKKLMGSIRHLFRNSASFAQWTS